MDGVHAREREASLLVRARRLAVHESLAGLVEAEHRDLDVRDRTTLEVERAPGQRAEGAAQELDPVASHLARLEPTLERRHAEARVALHAQPPARRALPVVGQHEAERAVR